jgi:hypothetical protein
MRLVNNVFIYSLCEKSHRRIFLEAATPYHFAYTIKLSPSRGMREYGLDKDDERRALLPYCDFVASAGLVIVVPPF